MDAINALYLADHRLAERRREADAERLLRFVTRSGTAVSRVSVTSLRVPGRAATATR
jgi:hypothetical protein